MVTKRQQLTEMSRDRAGGRKGGGPYRATVMEAGPGKLSSLA
jgi:hypothetical protein